LGDSHQALLERLTGGSCWWSHCDGVNEEVEEMSGR
jgi:hypothetical protein